MASPKPKKSMAVKKAAGTPTRGYEPVRNAIKAAPARRTGTAIAAGAPKNGLTQTRSVSKKRTPVKISVSMTRPGVKVTRKKPKQRLS